MARNGTGKLLIVGLSFMLLAVLVQARFRYDKDCYRKCALRYCRGKFALLCVALCQKKCEVHNSKTFHNSPLNCANSKCSNFTSGVIKDEGCVDYSCAEKWRKN